MLAVAVMTTAASAQQGGPRATPEERAKVATDQLSGRLHLTQVQQDSVYQINLRLAKQAQAQFGGAATREERMALMQKQQAERVQKIKALLTPEQQKEYDAVLKEREEQMRNFQNR